MHTPHKTRVWAMIETPEALFNIAALAAEAHGSETRLSGFVMRHQRSRQGDAGAARARPRADGVVADDVPRRPRMRTASTSSTASTTTSATRRASRPNASQARDMGFDGKTLIHPNQIDACNTVFSPGADEVAQARKHDRGVRSAGEQGQGGGVRSTAAWSSACMPRWRGAPSRSPRRSSRRIPQSSRPEVDRPRRKPGQFGPRR